jgi:hypothetical protein
MLIGRRHRVQHRWNALVFALIVGGGVCTTSTAVAQPSTPVSQLLPNLFGNTIVLTPAGSPEFPSHEAHFRPGVDQLQTPQQFNQQIVTLLATLPVGSSSGGFTYTFNPTLGTFSRSSDSFGPLFAERALTIGRDRASLGVGYQRSTYDTFEGKNLRHGGMTFHIEHIDCCGATRAGVPTGDGTRLNPAFEGDLIEATLTLRLTTQTVVFYGTYGLTDRLDIGVAVPLVSIDMDASVQARIERLATAANPDVHRFDGDTPDERIFAASAAATGLGDIVVRAKYNFLRTGATALAAAVDLRTPTGDESNLIATGGVQAKVYAIASSSIGKFSPHVNLGYTSSSRGALPDAALRDEWNYAAGFDLAVSPRLTLIADVLGRSIRGAGRLREADKVFEFVQTGPGGSGGGGGGGGTGGGGGGVVTPTPTQVTLREFRFEPGNLNLAVGNAGVRFNPMRTLLVSASLLFNLTQAGLRDRVTPVISVDYAF